MIKQLFTVIMVLSLLSVFSEAQERTQLQPKKGVSLRANKILFESSEFLKRADTFCFKMKVERDVIMYDDVRVHFGGVADVKVKRPDKLRADFDGDERKRQTFFDGHLLTMYLINRGTYVQHKFPGTIDNAFDSLFEKYGFSFPMIDLVYSDPYAILIENVDKGYMVGKHKVNGISCNHLVFKQELIDWQIWIEDSVTPFVRKVVITYKSEEGTPEYRSELSGWKINRKINDNVFMFIPLEKVRKIDLLPVQNIYKTDDENSESVKETEVK